MLVSKPDAWWTGVRRHGGHLGRLPQVQGAQIVGQKADRPAAIGGRGAKGDGLAAQGFGQPQVAPRGSSAAQPSSLRSPGPFTATTRASISRRPRWFTAS